MTKSIRIENADISEHTPIVQVWMVAEPEDLLMHEYELDSPTDMATECIHDKQYIVIKEK